MDRKTWLAQLKPGEIVAGRYAQFSDIRHCPGEVLGNADGSPIVLFPGGAFHFNALGRHVNDHGFAVEIVPVDAVIQREWNIERLQAMRWAALHGDALAKVCAVLDEVTHA